MKTIHQPPVSRAAMNLAYLVTQNARRFPERTALVWRERSWTWRELDADFDLHRSPPPRSDMTSGSLSCGHDASRAGSPASIYAWPGPIRTIIGRKQTGPRSPATSSPPPFICAACWPSSRMEPCGNVSPPSKPGSRPRDRCPRRCPTHNEALPFVSGIMTGQQ